VEKLKLLIVEDDAAVRNTMLTVLELEGYAPEAVASTREAIDRLAVESYPIVISDIYLDERTGLDAVSTRHRLSIGCCVE
jgi:CheY-like chemotaxis protein